jgi:membrane-associated phospholipid phosphatase
MDTVNRGSLAGRGSLADEVTVDRAPRPLLSSRARVVAAIVIPAAVLGLILLAWRYGGRSQPGRLDSRVDNWFFGLGVNRTFAVDVADLGSLDGVAVLAGALLVLFAVLRRPRLALLVLIAPPLAGALTEWGLKPWIGRTYAHAYSLPSGHTTGIVSIAAVIAVALADRRRPRLSPAVVVIASAPTVAVAVAVPSAQVLLHRHYATDTLGGAAVGLGTVLVVSLAIDLIALHTVVGAAPEARRTTTSMGYDR